MNTKPAQTRTIPKRDLRDFETTIVADQSWGEAYFILNEIDKSERWRATHRSFTSWVKDLANQSGVQESSVWRILTAGRFYTGLGPYLENLTLPPITEICLNVTAEQMELVEKISRVASYAEVEKLLLSAIEGTLTRDRLRLLWRIYRDNRSPKKVKTNDGTVKSKKDHSIQDEYSKRAKTLIALLETDPLWTGISKPNFFRALYHPPIRLLGKIDGVTTAYTPDALIVIQEKAEGEVRFHLLELISPHLMTNSTLASKYRIAKQYADFFWVILDAPFDNSTKSNLPKGMGVLSQIEGKFVVHHLPAPSNSIEDKSGTLAKALLVRVL